VPYDAVNGWTFDDCAAPTEIVLNGDACDSARTDGSLTLTLVLGCATVAN